MSTTPTAWQGPVATSASRNAQIRVAASEKRKDSQEGCLTKGHARREAGSQSHGTHPGRPDYRNHKESGMKKLGKALGAVAIAGAIAAGGSAFTAANTLPRATSVHGYGQETITGVTATSVNYVLSANKSTITAVGLVLDGDTTTDTIQVGFNAAAPATCANAGSYDSTNDETTYNCNGLSQAVATTNSFELVAS
jgi:hypothetical protein